jgi:hypothetical protein
MLREEQAVAALDSVAEWLQVGLNAGALVAGSVIWKMYFENLKATISSKEAEASLANKQVDYWREKAGELEKRSPEAVERVLAERIRIRESEIESLAKDRVQGSQELERVEQEVAVMRRTVEQTQGFRQMLALEMAQPSPEDPEWLDQLKNPHGADDDAVVQIEVVHMGNVGVDSGQLMITDPCYIDSEWQEEEYQSDRVYKDSQSGAVIKWGDDFMRFDEPLVGYSETPEHLIASGRLVQLPKPPTPEIFKYSYNGACQATQSVGHGEMAYRLGHPGAGVAFHTAWGDGVYTVYGEKHDGRIVRVYVNVG